MKIKVMSELKLKIEIESLVYDFLQENIGLNFILKDFYLNDKYLSMSLHNYVEQKLMFAESDMGDGISINFNVKYDLKIIDKIANAMFAFIRKMSKKELLEQVDPLW